MYEVCPHISIEDTSDDKRYQGLAYAVSCLNTERLEHLLACLSTDQVMLRKGVARLLEERNDARTREMSRMSRRRAHNAK